MNDAIHSHATSKSELQTRPHAEKKLGKTGNAGLNLIHEEKNRRADHQELMLKTPQILALAEDREKWFREFRRPRQLAATSPHGTASTKTYIRKEDGRRKIENDLKTSQRGCLRKRCSSWLPSCCYHDLL